MKNTLIALALGAVSTMPALAQQQPQADYCHPSGYVTGVAHADDSPQACDPRQVPRVHGVPQAQAAPTARRGYDQRYMGNNYDGRDANNRNWRDANNRDGRDANDRWREGNYYYGARGPEWRRGGHIPREYMGRQYRVDDWRAHRLSAPPRGYQWVQVGNDYVLVALATGIIAQLLLAQQ